VRGYLTSYASLFREQSSGAPHIHKIEIPLIQRDYAQGRPDAATMEIRTDFLEVLLGAIAGGGPIGLDFIYGRVESGTFHPLDGQQRLTTLYLIHWYVASLAGELQSDAPWTRFSYATRPSARFFCESLVKHPLPPDHDAPVNWIKDQPWYLYTWRNDPTIQSMLVMIDAIHKEAQHLGLRLDAKAAWGRLTAADSSAVSFYLLPLKDMESEDDLYIKMNSRGKPLTEFENFKAHFEQDISHSARADEFAHRIDGPWADLMWPFRGGDDIVDDEFVRFIDYITEISELRDGQLGSGRIGPRARAIFGPENRKSGEHLNLLFSAFDVWRDATHVRDTFERVFSTSLPGEDGYDPDKVVLFESSSVNLFEQCCHQFDSQSGGNRVFTLQQSLLLYAVLLHLVEKTVDFTRRVRTLRNLLAASAEDEVRRSNMPGLLKDVEALVIDGDLDAVSKLSGNQVQNERDKAKFLAACPHLTRTVFRLEDHPILRGTLSSFELTADDFQQRADAFETAFSDPAQWLDLTGALLATGDYQRRRPGTPRWQFGTASTANSAVWRYLLTAGTHEDLVGTRTVLAEFLDGLAGSDTDPQTHLIDVMAAWLAEHEQRTFFDWRYYLVRYPAMRGSRNDGREGRTGIYLGVDGELSYSLCMLRTYYLNGYYRDPVLLQVWISSHVQDAARDPWFIGPETTPRWLRLDRSLVGLRSVAEGFELEGPEDELLHERFLKLCGQREDVTMKDGRIVLHIKQTDRAGDLIDSVDRVVVGAEFVKELVDAGL
jgi:Protein of unknown function DUF262